MESKQINNYEGMQRTKSQPEVNEKYSLNRTPSMFVEVDQKDVKSNNQDKSLNAKLNEICENVYDPQDGDFIYEAQTIDIRDL